MSRVPTPTVLSGGYVSTVLGGNSTSRNSGGVSGTITTRLNVAPASNILPGATVVQQASALLTATSPVRKVVIRVQATLMQFYTNMGVRIVVVPYVRATSGDGWTSYSYPVGSTTMEFPAQVVKAGTLYGGSLNFITSSFYGAYPVAPASAFEVVEIELPPSFTPGNFYLGALVACQNLQDSGATNVRIHVDLQYWTE